MVYVLSPRILRSAGMLVILYIVGNHKKKFEFEGETGFTPVSQSNFSLECIEWGSSLQGFGKQDMV